MTEERLGAERYLPPATCHLPRFTHHVLRCPAIAANSVPRYTFSVQRSSFPPRFNAREGLVMISTRRPGLCGLRSADSAVSMPARAW